MGHEETLDKVADKLKLIKSPLVSTSDGTSITSSMEDVRVAGELEEMGYRDDRNAGPSFHKVSRRQWPGNLLAGCL